MKQPIKLGLVASLYSQTGPQFTHISVDHFAQPHATSSCSRALPSAGSTEASKVLSQIAEKVREAAIRELQQHAILFPPVFQNALHRMGQPYTPSSGGETERNVVRL